MTRLYSSIKEKQPIDIYYKILKAYYFFFNVPIFLKSDLSVIVKTNQCLVFNVINNK